jgi:hypothetical protein
MVGVGDELMIAIARSISPALGAGCIGALAEFGGGMCATFCAASVVFIAGLSLIWIGATGQVTGTGG